MIIRQVKRNSEGTLTLSIPKKQALDNNIGEGSYVYLFRVEERTHKHFIKTEGETSE